MNHYVPLIATLAAAFGLALVLGFVAARLRLPALVGYLLAGIVIGRTTPGFVADVEIAAQLAEIGVMLLMFGVGLHLSLDELLSVRKIALPGAIVQMVVATALGAGIASSWGWSVAGAIVFGLSLRSACLIWHASRPQSFDWRMRCRRFRSSRAHCSMPRWRRP